MSTPRFPTLRLARRNLARNRLRSALAALGILIGVLAIATLGVFGNVLQLSAAESIGGIGNQVIVSPDGDAGVEALDARDVQRIERAVGDRGAVVPLVTGTGLVEGPTGRTGAQLYGTTDARALFTAAEGTIPERLRQGAVVGQDVAAATGVRVGGIVDVGEESFRVVAVLQEPETFTPIQPGSAVVVSPDAFADGDVSQVVVQAPSGADARAAAAAIRERLNARQDRVSVLALTSIVAEIERFFGLLSSFLLGLASISLVVAGVSILNVMLMTTVERRQEIGVMRAVGIQRGSVLRLILVEAGLLGLVGSVLGVLGSALIVWGLYAVAPISLSVILAPSNGVYLLVAFGFGVVVSLLSGLYPAYRAANLRPVEALRS